MCYSQFVGYLDVPDKYITYYVLEFFEKHNAPPWVSRVYLYGKYSAESCFYYFCFSYFLNEYVAVCLTVLIVVVGVGKNWPNEKRYLERPVIKVFRPNE